MMKGSGAGYRAGPVFMTIGYGCGSYGFGFGYGSVPATLVPVQNPVCLKGCIVKKK